MNEGKEKRRRERERDTSDNHQLGFNVNVGRTGREFRCGFKEISSGKGRKNISTRQNESSKCKKVTWFDRLFNLNKGATLLATRRKVVFPKSLSSCHVQCLAFPSLEFCLSKSAITSKRRIAKRNRFSYEMIFLFTFSFYSFSPCYFLLPPLTPPASLFYSFLLQSRFIYLLFFSFCQIRINENLRIFFLFVAFLQIFLDSRHVSLGNISGKLSRSHFIRFYDAEDHKLRDELNF